MSAIRLNLIGGFQCLTSDGHPVEFTLAKDQGLIAILALSEGYVCPRSHIIDLLWSSRGDEQARVSLRHSLWSLKKILGDGADEVLQIDRKRIGLNPDRLTSDVGQFLELANSSKTEDIEKAVTLYKGDLLENLIIRDQVWDEWLTLARESLGSKLAELLCTLIDRYTTESRPKKLIDSGHRLVELDPFREQGHRALMRGYAESNQRPLALKQFERCRDLLQKELNSSPSPETQELFLQIKNGRSVTVQNDVETASQAEINLVAQSAVRYCLSDDGVSIAHAQVGKGYPLVAAGSWITHLQEDWSNPGWGHYLRHLAKDFTLIRYDQRGNGMSDWDNVDISFDKMVDDLSSVIDCYDYEKVAIFGPSQAASVSIAYAQKYPEKVSHLILYGGYSRGRRRRGDPDSAAESEALVTLIRQGWGRDNPAIRQTMTSLFMPDANQQEAAWFNEFQKTCGPAANIARFREMFDEIYVTDLLADIKVPTLVIHCVDDSVAPLSEGKLIASRIPDARFVTLNSKNHMVFEKDPEFSRFLHYVHEFMELD
jgi:DNA-binding SARP family transcriptional activator/alpha-beta hydrolase superfamily lysophospholipase